MLVELLGGVVASCMTVYMCIKLFVPWLLTDISYLKKILPVTIAFDLKIRKQTSIVDVFEGNVRKNPDKIFLLFEDEKYSYQEVDERANKIGRVVLSLGQKKDDTVALVHNNSPEFVCIFLGLLKIGVRVSMINTNLRGKALSHCLEVSETNTILVDNASDLISAVNDIMPNFPNASVYVLSASSDKFPERFTCLEDQLNQVSSDKVDVSLRSGILGTDDAVYIFTSGTTGLPKAAVVTHKKLMMAYIVPTASGVKSDDVIYASLPLYHSSALVLGLGAAIVTDSTVAIAKKFSKSNFFKDVRKYEATVMIYIGELCRYLLTNEKSDLDTQHKLRIAIGNGLRHDIFEEFKTRFGIENVVECYACTEGNVGFMNIFNVIGACGRSSPFLQLFLKCGLFEWDVKNECLTRDKNGLCIPVKQGEPGLLLMQVNKLQVYNGYKGNKKMSNSKIVCDVRRTGTSTSTLGENVSTTEVSNLLTEVSFVVDACVYGVEIPGYDGKAGMATLLMGPESQPVTSVELKAISDFNKHCLCTLSQCSYV